MENDNLEAYALEARKATATVVYSLTQRLIASCVNRIIFFI